MGRGKNHEKSVLHMRRKKKEWSAFVGCLKHKVREREKDRERERERES